MNERQPTKRLLERVAQTAEGKESVSVGDVLEAAGHGSFGPLLLFAGLMIVMPIIGDIPGMPTIMGVIVLLTAGQLLLGREHFWLPRVLLERSMSSGRISKGARWMQRPARYVDRLLRPRLTVFVRGIGVHVIALVSVAVAALTPAMELVPFSANGAGLALGAFGLALMAEDGLVALLALVVTAATAIIVIYALVAG